MNSSKSRKKYLLKNILVIGIGSIATKLISFFLVPFYTNILSTKEYGIIDLLYTICNIVFPLITLNICEAVLRFSMDKDANHKNIINIGNLMIIVSIFLGILAIPILNLFDTYKDYSLLFYLYLITFGSCEIFLCFLRGKEQLVDYSIGNFLYIFFVGILNVVFLKFFHLGIKGYFLAYIISNILITIFSFFRGKVYKSIISFKVDKTLMKQMVKYSFLLIPNSFMWWIMNTSDRIMVTNFVNIEANGIYAVSYKIPSLLTSITSIFTTAWLYSAVSENDSKDKNDYTSKVFNVLVSVVLLLSSFVLLILKPFMKVYVSSQYYSAWKYVPLLIIGYTVLTLATFFSTSYNVNKDSKGMLLSGLFGAIINIVLNFILIPQYEVYGAALATAISYISVFVYRFFDTKKYVNIRVFTKEFVIGFIMLFVQVLSLYINSNYFYILSIVCTVGIIVNYRKNYRSLIKNMFSMVKKKSGGKDENK